MRDRLLTDPDVADWLRRHTGGRPVDAETVQSLWSGYGEIVRVHLDDGPAASVIVKWVEPAPDNAHPRGWSGATAHGRKLRSYEVECAWYRDWVPQPQPGSRTAACAVAERHGTGWRFLLEDLDAAGYGGRGIELSPERIEACLRWLAAFHALYLGVKPRGLWPCGTYWHLATRQDELAAMRDEELRAAAPVLAEKLESCRFQTLVHGDCKAANFCFADGGTEPVAAVDFQYVGGGPGIKDVAYFLSSCLDDAQCEVRAPALLDDYFGHLRERLDPAVDGAAVEREWRALYPAAWADFHRFLVGWAPDHWKIHRYTRAMTRQALATL